MEFLAILKGGPMVKLRKRIWEIVEIAKPGDTVSKIVDCFILGVIFLNVVAVVVGTVRSVQDSFGDALAAFEVFSVVVFSVEYVLRLWSCASAASFKGPVMGRIRFALTPMEIIDLLAILPFYLPFFGVDFRFLRILRLFRIIRIAKVGRYYSSLKVIRSVVLAKKEELLLSIFIMLALLLLSACIMYYCENGAQPEVFPDIPSTMWWSIITLTTVGYGDVFPITPVGKFFAAIIAVLGVGMFALPTGILGAGFVEAITKNKTHKTCCPHCGKEIEQ